ncbi:unnamed protein product [Tilletia controversa]|nr:unnamed protein product [Tilletia controversa]CAD6905466.1 unnamed protein product [Tilletia controversa]
MDDDARKALALARKHYDAGNNPTALKWATKSNSIAPSPEAQFLIQKLSSSASTSASATANGATTARQRTAPAASSSSSSSAAAAAHSAPKREFTKEHQEVVLRVRKAGSDYYQVLSCDKSVDESGIKKAYRKLALQLHPDKNAAPGADEAFKLVGKAFAVLSDPDKRAAYDRYGGDPDDARSAAGAQAARAGGGGFPAQQFRGGFGDEIDPTEIFNMFFGTGAGMGGVHMNMNGQTFSFGGGGPSAFRTAQFGGGAAGGRAGGRRTQQGGQQRERTHQDASIWLQILPLLIIGLFTILTALPSIFLTPDPKFAFAPTGAYRSQRFTPQHGVSYYVDQTAFGRHPFVAENSQSNGGLPGFERRVERSWVGQLEEDCSRRRDSQDRRYQQELGFFGIGANLDLARKIRAEKYESCERLRDWGIVM